MFSNALATVKSVDVLILQFHDVDLFAYTVLCNRITLKEAIVISTQKELNSESDGINIIDF